MQDLPIRLEMVLEQVKSVRKDDRSGRIIDVGSDHGYLAIRCLEEGLAGSAVCTEIHNPPAKRSMDALVEAGFGDIFMLYRFLPELVSKCKKVILKNGISGSDSLAGSNPKIAD